MEKRTLIAIILSVLVFYVFSAFFAPKKTPIVAENPVKQTVISSASITSSVPTTPGLLPQQSISNKNVIVETDLYKAVFSTHGAALQYVILKKYSETNVSNSSKVSIGNNADPKILNLSTEYKGFNVSSDVIYSCDVDSLKVSGTEVKAATFQYLSDNGLLISKQFIFTGNEYGIKINSSVKNNSAFPVSGIISYMLSYPASYNVKDSRYEVAGSYVYADNSLYIDKSKDVEKATKKYDNSVSWAGFSDKYFMTALLLDIQNKFSVEINKNSDGYLVSKMFSPQISVAAGQSVDYSLKAFVGPKDIDVLKAQSDTFEKSLDLGWFSSLAKPLLYALKFFYSYVGNYGVAIIIVTVILKLIFFPLTHKSYKSMKGMQKIQPEMANIREKYKNDRDGMNKAVMELYRDHKVNPLGGCLPMVVQIPVFFALYKALMFSIELRHAPFYFWITDLSSKDPYYVTPVIMGVTMFIQQKMTPSNMDPMQQKIMLMLPVVFTFMFLGFPSGLVLYWLVNNILTILQQWYINKKVV